MSTPAVGQSVVWDGDPHVITSVKGNVAEFAAEGGTVRSVGLQDLVAHGDGWGVLGRTEKRPHRTSVGIIATRATEEG
jgi:hypothetical protein